MYFKNPLFFYLIIALIGKKNVCDGAKILLATMPQGKSHAGSFFPLLERLVEDGHNVTVHFEIYRPELQLGGGIKEHLILMNDIDYSMELNPVFSSMIWRKDAMYSGITIPYYIACQSCSHMLQHYTDQFWHLVNQTWDLVLVDSMFSPCGYALALLKKKPFILMHSSGVENVFTYGKAYAKNYALIPPHLIKNDYAEYHVTNFADRFTSFTGFIQENFYYKLWINMIIKYTIWQLVNFDVQSIMDGTSFSFYDMPETIVWPSPRSNDLISFGAQCKEVKKLKGDYLEFISSPSSKGTILIAFGTICKWDFAPKTILEAFMNAINRLDDYRIVWAYSGPKLSMKGHVKLDKWVPQPEILNHPKTKLFISHGGLKSVKETICSETPVVYMPIFAEQVQNSWMAREHGFAEYVNKKNVTSDYLFNQISRVLNSSGYQKAVSRLRNRFQDRIITGLDRSSFWFRKLLQYKGKMPDFFYSFGRQLGFISYFHLDLLVTIILSILVTNELN